ncbi:MAG TPA: R3H domain-containing nucleic acid-binding protein [Candidatus Paceibacterota bacterium]|nr:R3H domain-containing nucleic acid-binding protein [Candidatus Paceibacterota bacterium]
MTEVSQQKLDKDDVLRAVKKMAGFMNIECQIEAREEPADSHGEGAVVVSVQTLDNARFLIGKNGQNLKALEHVLRAMLVKDGKEGTIILDVNDYKKSRATYLIDVAKQTVTRVRNTQKAEALFPMSAYERRIVHMELAAYPDIATESVGAEPQRRVVIKPYP